MMDDNEPLDRKTSGEYWHLKIQGIVDTSGEAW